MSSEDLERLVEGEQVTPNNRRIELPWTHLPKPPRSIRAACAASIFRRWGT
jgi:hypothetical protein